MYQKEIESAQTAFQMDQEEQSKQEAIADEHLKEINCGKVLQLRRGAYKKGYEEAIEKACEWLKENMSIYVSIEHTDWEKSELLIEKEELITELKKAMEE